MKININKIFLYISLFFFFLVIAIRPFFDSIIDAKFSLIIYAISIILLLIPIIKKNTLKVNRVFIALCILLFLPCLYNNAYINDKLYSYFVYYVFTIIYAILLNCSDVEEKDVILFVNCLVIFSLLTSIVSWITYFNNDLYIKKVLPFFNKNLQIEIKQDLLLRRYIPGLTSHYSRNAFYIMLGIFGTYYKYKRLNYSNKIRYIGILSFLIITFLFIGKRGHFLFFAISGFICYFIYKKFSVKSIIKFIIYMLTLVMILFVLFKSIPALNYTYEKFFNNNGDYSTGRIDMYEDAYNLYKNNSYKPIGWGGYAKSTNYHHPGLHNDYLQLYFETGIIGFLFVIISNVYIMKKAKDLLIKTRDAKSIIIFTYNLFFMLYSLTGIPHYDIEVYMTYFLINSVLFKCLVEGDKNEEN